MNPQSKIKKVIMAVLLLVVGMMAYAASTGQLTSAPQSLIATMAVPFQKISTSLSNKFDLWMDKKINIDNIVEENEKLKKELADMRASQMAFDRIVQENKEYKKLLGVTEDIISYDTIDASVIGRDGMDKFYSFTIDKGEKHGVEVNDVVMTSDGVVGVIVETGYNFSKVATILSPAVSVGCFVGPERDIGIASGSYNLTENKTCVVDYLPKETQAKEGDLVSSTGYGTVFPKDLIIGTVESVDINESGNSMRATVKPAADITNVKFVFVITDFN